jgi:hypothetical protein
MKRPSVGVFLLCFMIFMALAMACNSKIATPVSSPDQISEKDVLLKINTDKDIYTQGEIIHVTGSAENISAKKIEVSAAYEFAPVYIYLNTNSKFGFPLYDQIYKIPPTIMPLIESRQLEPHSTVIKTVIWDQVIGYNNQQVPEGTYQFTCGITLGNINNSSRKDLSISSEISIVCPPGWITMEQAKIIALDLLEVKSWQETHSGNSVIKKENGTYYVLEMSQWKNISPEFTSSERNTPLSLINYKYWMPDVKMLAEDGKWTIRMGTRLGLSPHYVRIRIDPVTKAIVETLFSDSPL